MNAKKEVLDNRMEWIRNLEDLNQSTESSGWWEFEVLSECKICGMLDYDNGKIMCYPLTFEKDKNDLYAYLLRIQYSKIDITRDWKQSRNGYYFIDGIRGELLSLFSLFFQCRFYLIASYIFLSDTQKIKTEENFLYQKCDNDIHSRIFNDQCRNFAGGLSSFLDSIKELKSEKHQSFVLACWHYARSLKSVGIDNDMIFVRLVSSIEALLKEYELCEEDNPLDQSNFDDLFADAKLSSVQCEQLKKILRVEANGLINIDKNTFKFKSFIKKYSVDFDDIRHELDANAPILYVTHHNFEKVLGSIYNARSGYLHAGEPMLISSFMNMAEDWHFDPSVGRTIDKRKFVHSQKLPYPHWFENLVRYCLKTYLSDCLKKEVILNY